MNAFKLRPPPDIVSKQACWLVSNVARQADVCSSLIYRWRREIGEPFQPDQRLVVQVVRFVDE